jgi:aminoglycoside 3'-phosphotransferase-1
MLRDALRGYAPVRVRSGESGAKIYRFKQRGRRALYLKYGSGRLARQIAEEFVRLQWLNDHLPSARVVHFSADRKTAWMLTEALPGRSAYDILSTNAERHTETVRAIAGFMRRLHDLPLETCPFLSDHKIRMIHARRNIEAGTVDTSDFDEQRRGWTADRVWSELNTILPARFDRVVTHGDFSLDNVFIERGRVTGIIDAGRLGIADRYQDLAILWNNLAEFGAGLQRTFVTAYGVSRLDKRRLDFHLCLDELF